MTKFAAARYVSALVLGLGLSTAALADERIEHFKGKPAKTLDQAVENFVQYNHRLEMVLAQEATDARLVEIHELTYTLENALEKLNAEMAALADTLEEVHVASETYDREALAEAAERYLEVVESLRRLGGS